mgnify:CR=1 FL=1
MRRGREAVAGHQVRSGQRSAAAEPHQRCGRGAAVDARAGTAGDERQLRPPVVAPVFTIAVALVAALGGAGERRQHHGTKAAHEHIAQEDIGPAAHGDGGAVVGVTATPNLAMAMAMAMAKAMAMAMVN